MKRLLCIAALICAFTIPVAAHAVPDLNQTGSISITIRYGGEPVSGGELTLYRAADILEDDGNYSFVLTEPFDGADVTLETVQSAETARKLSDYALKQKISGTSGKISTNGTLTFENLQPGLYLLAQRKAAAGYQKLSPFLVSLPMRQPDGYSYHVDASPKVSPIPNPPGNPDQPATGQSIWPVWIFSISTLSLAIVLSYKKRMERK